MQSTRSKRDAEAPTIPGAAPTEPDLAPRDPQDPSFCCSPLAKETRSRTKGWVFHCCTFGVRCSALPKAAPSLEGHRRVLRPGWMLPEGAKNCRAGVRGTGLLGDAEDAEGAEAPEGVRLLVTVPQTAAFKNLKTTSKTGRLKSKYSLVSENEN